LRVTQPSHVQIETVESPPREPGASGTTRSPSGESTAPIVSSRGRRSSTKIGRLNADNIRQVFESLRRGRKGTFSSEASGRGTSRENTMEYVEEELVFLSWLDDEILKIDEFYRQKENEAAERYKALSAQLETLRQFRDLQRFYDSNQSSGIASRAEPSRPADALRRSWVQYPIDRLRASMDAVSSAMPESDHERRAKEPEFMAHPISTSMTYVEYRVARRRLKQALLEFYRGMELLKSYRLLNRTGLSKILKKFDKTTGRKISSDYHERLKTVYFFQSDTLEEIMDHTEVCTRKRKQLILGCVRSLF
jgi:xenotropic and polytropic retrovirus receptor 1